MFQFLSFSIGVGHRGAGFDRCQKLISNTTDCRKRENKIVTRCSIECHPRQVTVDKLNKLMNIYFVVTFTDVVGIRAACFLLRIRAC